jgi:succinate dehydrogenase / fumarate reductase flavoprotein subunit
VFGRRAGQAAAQHVDSVSRARPAVSQAALDAAVAEALESLERAGGENPYEVHAALQQLMTDQVGLIRNEGELQSALAELEKLRARAAHVSVEGGRAYNPGWHLAQDLRNMLLVADCVAQSALERQESRGGHTREDYPQMSPTWRQVNLVCTLQGGEDQVNVAHQPGIPMREDLLELFELSELKKYMTEPELAGVSAGAPAAAEETR